MKRVLLTGMSGTGKSALIRELAARGYAAVDLDDGAWSAWADAEGDPTGARPGEDWLWREDRVAALLDADGEGTLFVAGCAPNMGAFLGRFDHVVLLTAPVAVMLTRLATRADNPYGKRPEEVAAVLVNLREVEPRLRAAAGHEVDTDAPLAEVVARVLRCVGA
jgi:broad-specificity NMP kinase